MAGTLPESTSDASRQPRSSAFLPEHIRVVGRMTLPPERRPVHGTIDNIADWLLEWRQLSQGIASFDEFAWRLVAAGMPLLRVTLHTATLHPQFLGTTITWWPFDGGFQDLKVHPFRARRFLSVCHDALGNRIVRVYQ